MAPPRALRGRQLVLASHLLMTDSFLRFMGSDRGRITRVAVGASLLTWGLMSLDRWPGRVASVAALAPLLTGLSDRCVLPPPSNARGEDKDS
ncbi:MAG: hypothetical protein SangKO_098930 [Sandaracinaceae bacterium]